LIGYSKTGANIGFFSGITAFRMPLGAFQMVAPFGRETPPVVFAEDGMTPVPLVRREQEVWYLFFVNMLSLRDILCDHLKFTHAIFRTNACNFAAE
jgi:hypothetical protein